MRGTLPTARAGYTSLCTQERKRPVKIFQRSVGVDRLTPRLAATECDFVAPLTNVESRTGSASMSPYFSHGHVFATATIKLSSSGTLCTRRSGLQPGQVGPPSVRTHKKVHSLSQPMRVIFTLVNNFLLTQTSKQFELLVTHGRWHSNAVHPIKSP